MYAVVTSGGKQYKVEEGETLKVEKIPGKVGSAVTFDRVLMISDGTDINIGQPVLVDATVEGHIVEQGKAKKILVFKYKRRKRYRRKYGHRQPFTAVKIDSINARGITPGKKTEPEAKAPAAPKAVQKKKEVKKPVAKPATKKKEAPKTAKPKAKKTEAKAAPKKAEPAKVTKKKSAAKKTAAPKAGAKKTAAKKPAAQKASARKKAEDKTK